MTWNVEYTDEFKSWWDGLTRDEMEKIDACVFFLEDRGPGLGRPLVDNIEKSRHPNMKELRPPGTKIRILFAFDPRRVAIILIGGDKTGRWKEWYDENIPIADALYEEYLEELRREGELP